MYAYQSDLWCDDCAADIMSKLGPNTDDSPDTDDYPQRASDSEETDCPNHCAAGEECLNAIELPSGCKAGELLDCSLTADGVEYVREALRAGGEVAALWAEHYDIEPDDDADADADATL